MLQENNKQNQESQSDQGSQYNQTVEIIKSNFKMKRHLLAVGQWLSINL